MGLVLQRLVFVLAQLVCGGVARWLHAEYEGIARVSPTQALARALVAAELSNAWHIGGGPYHNLGPQQRVNLNAANYRRVTFDAEPKMMGLKKRQRRKKNAAAQPAADDIMRRTIKAGERLEALEDELGITEVEAISPCGGATVIINAAEDPVPSGVSASVTKDLVAKGSVALSEALTETWTGAYYNAKNYRRGKIDELSNEVQMPLPGSTMEELMQDPMQLQAAQAEMGEAVAAGAEQLQAARELGEAAQAAGAELEAAGAEPEAAGAEPEAAGAEPEATQRSRNEQLLGLPGKP